MLSNNFQGGFGKLYPSLLNEWDYIRNEKINPMDIGVASKKYVFWHCKKCNKKWKASVVNRLKGRRKCLCDSSLLFKNPELAKEWHPTKNGKLKPVNVSEYKRKIVWWRCKKCKHEWKESIMERSRGWIYGWNNCFKCRSAGASVPKLLKYWHPTKNGKLTPFDFFPQSSKIAWWIHKKNKKYHIWKASIDSMFSSVERGSNGCPFCHGNRVCKENSLKSKFPLIAKEWHPTKNGKLKPQNITYGSSVNIWWKCHACKHEWETVVTHRTYCNNGCPKCSLNKVVLKDGARCASKVEAFFYLKYKKEKLTFLHNNKYGNLGKRGWCRYDFYFPDKNTYIEVTSFTKSGFFRNGIDSSRNKEWEKYRRKIEKKRKYVKNVLHANFKFITHILTPSEKLFVNKNIKNNS